MTSSGAPRADLFFRQGETVVHHRVLRLGERIVVGRGERVDVRLDDDALSRQHAWFELRRDGVYVTDLGSLNGTTVGCHLLREYEPARQLPGKITALGTHEVRVHLQGVEAGSAFAVTPAPAPRPPLPREEFEILCIAGEGALGRVWAAHQTALDRVVAIKELHSLEPGARDRFAREAKLLCRLENPHVVRCYDVRFVEGNAYLILEFVPGPTAGELIQRRGRLDLVEALQIGEHVARALVSCAQLGLVHRDVKPDNILLHPEGAAKLCDFGIAKEHGAAKLTQTGLGLGSLPYASPEQVLTGTGVDARADLYSLGATIYALIAGQPPFPPLPNQSVLQQIQQVVREQPPRLTDLEPSCPEEVAAVIHRLLDKDPNRRLQTAERAAAELAALRGACPTGPVVENKRATRSTGRLAQCEPGESEPA